MGDVLGSARGLACDELSDLNAAIGEHSARAVRMHPSFTVADMPFETQPIPWYDRGRWLVDSGTRPGAFLNYAAGDFYIQDAGSMLALALCDVKPGQWLCDTCAAPGGKSSGLLEQLRGSGLVVSNEVIRSRLDLLELTLARTGHANYLVANCEVESLAELCDDVFDCVVVDAPCTGQSMVARGKQSRASFSSKQIEHSAARQQRILRAAQRLVKPGGRLVYSTCTFAFAENEGIIQWFRNEFPEWVPLSVPALSTWESDFSGCYRLWPHRDACAGAFAACLIRPNDSTSQPLDLSADGNLNSPSQSFARPRGGEFAPVELSLRELPWLQASQSSIRLSQRGSELHYFSDAIPDEWLAMAHAGVTVAEKRGGDWLPSYAASVVQIPDWNPTYLTELDDRQAADYLTGAAIRPTEGHWNQKDALADSPWHALTWRNRRLAWGKLAGGVLKNHLPKALRKPQLIVPATRIVSLESPQLPTS